MKICSLLPSATEIVCALGLQHRLVAVTHECDFPPGVESLPRITRSAIEHGSSSSAEIHRHIAESVHGGSSIYHLDHDLLEKLQPDLILTQELCDVCAVSYAQVQQAVRMLDASTRVVSLEPTGIEDILQTVLVVGRLAGSEAEAERLVGNLRQRLDAIQFRVDRAERRPTVLTLEWLDPAFAGGHWVPEMIRLAGGRDVLGREREPSFVAPWEEIFASDPEVIVLMPCGFSLKRTLHEYSRVPLPPDWQSMQAVRRDRVFAVDGSSFFNRPGPRIVDGVEILAEILHPELFSRRSPPESWQRVQAEHGPAPTGPPEDL